MSTKSLLRLSEGAKNAFRDCVRNQNPQCVLGSYDKKAVLKGTFSKKSVRGHTDIEKYFKKLFRNVDDVKFGKDPIIFRKNDLIFECGDYVFIREDGEKIKANYQFILTYISGKWKILTHFSSLFPK